MKIIIVGASHGGVEAVDALVEGKEYDQIDWFEKSDIATTSGWNPNKAAEYISDLEKQGVKIHEHAEVISLNAENKQIEVLEVDQNKQYNFDKLILGQGSNPVELPIPGNDLAGVEYLRQRSDTNKLRQSAQNDDVKNVVVVGAGYIGMMAVDLFSSVGKHVTLVDLIKRPLGTYLDTEMTDRLGKVMDERHVEVALGQQVSTFEGDGHVERVITDKSSFDADLVIVSVGTRPNTQWLNNQLELTPNGSLKVNEFMQTSNPDIFAIGDLVPVSYTPSNSELNIALGSNARRTARTAVRNLFEQHAPLMAVQGSSGLDILGYNFASAGLNTTSAAKMNIPVSSVYVEQAVSMRSEMVKPDLTVQFKLFYNPKTLEVVGGQIMSQDNQTANINALSIAIYKHVTIMELAEMDFFFQPDLTNVWNVMNVAGRKAMKQENIK
ncbi:FAD-dependent oxidoreductase [Pediococcus argentinicus]|uniref:NADH peroxidase n=1 Tax=Pediococcus argentinicus TaxID=480391 RepID=A0A0R2NKK9_9LACO|nr:FAD-dependent oxidoreductase [Pediococcus argentinicus]KRO24880.1 NADH peroxidase [Pediococcus argentinicus]NKZ22577.1 FAD-dependent oxidoreductase [Pediococcus argentinicus]GEP19762.1 NADH peroxidase [Pediococcus argentinicus]